MFYKRLSAFALVPVFLFSRVTSKDTDNIQKNRFYIQPQVLFNAKYAFPALGIGYRFHQEKHGADVSLNVFLIKVFWRKYFLPFLKSSYIYYPSNNGFYLGMGANVGFISLGPLATIGYEFTIKNKIFTFVQLDATYVVSRYYYSRFLGTFALGIGF